MVLSADSFNRANGAIGSTDGAGSLDPVAWTNSVGAWAITSNKANASTAPGHATIDLGTADMDVSLVLSTLDGQNGLIFRWSSSGNYWRWISDFFQLQLAKVVGGTPTNVGTFHTAANGDTVRVVANGNSITCYRNGVIQETQTDSFNSTATRAGMMASTTGSRMDDWSATGTAVVTTVTGTQSSETDSSSSGTVVLNTIVTGTQATETDTATSGAVPVDTIVAGAQAIETDSAGAGTTTGMSTIVGGMALESDVGRSGYTARPIAHTCVRRVWLELGALEIDLHNETGGWFVTSFDPGSPAIREVVNNRPDADGIDDVTRYMGGRVVSADISALTAAGAIIDDVACSFAPFMVPSVRPELHYVLDRPGLPERILIVRASQYAFQVDNDYQRDIHLQWVASDPVARDPETESATAWAGSSTDAGRTYNLTFDRTYPAGGSTPTPASLFNDGDVPIHPLLKIWGPATGATVSFTGAGGDGAVAFLNSYTISGGHFIEVDCDARTAYLDGHRNQSVLAFLDWAAMTTQGWPTLLPRLGAVMSYTAGSTTDATQVVAYWHTGWLA